MTQKKTLDLQMSESSNRCIIIPLVIVYWSGCMHERRVSGINTSGKCNIPLQRVASHMWHDETTHNTTRVTAHTYPVVEKLPETCTSRRAPSGLSASPRGCARVTAPAGFAQVPRRQESPLSHNLYEPPREPSPWRCRRHRSRHHTGSVSFFKTQ